MARRAGGESGNQEIVTCIFPLKLVAKTLNWLTCFEDSYMNLPLNDEDMTPDSYIDLPLGRAYFFNLYKEVYRLLNVFLLLRVLTGVSNRAETRINKGISENRKGKNM